MSEHIKRLARYVEVRRLKPMLGIDGRIHGVHVGTEWEAEVRLSDIAAALDHITRLESDVEVLREALAKIAAENDLSGVPDDQLEAYARNGLYSCELIATETLSRIGGEA